MFRSLRYRYDNEQAVLFLTILLMVGVTVLASSVTFCVSGIFIIGHEMGHTWLNTIVGGIAGIPAPFDAAYFL